MIKELTFKGEKVKVNIDNPKEHLQKYWALGVFYELDLLSYIHQNYKKGINIIDVGGCIGNHTLFFASIMEAEKVVTFEPVPELYERINHVVDLNELVNVDIKSVALHNKKSTAKIHVSDLELNVGMSKMDVAGEITVKTNRLDNYNFDSEHINLIKIDIEGNNINMLKGAKKTLMEHKPDIFIESTDDFEDVESLLAEYGYKFTGKTFCKTPTHLFQHA